MSSSEMTTSDAALDSTELQTIFEYVDSLALPIRGRAENRVFDRRRLRAPCTVRYISPDGDHVMGREGRMRDISRSGIGFLIKHCFARGTQLHVTTHLSESKVVDFTGTVTFSRLIRLGWYAVGMQFSPVCDDRLVAQVCPGRIHVVKVE